MYHWKNEKWLHMKSVRVLPIPIVLDADIVVQSEAEVAKNGMSEKLHWNRFLVEKHMQMMISTIESPQVGVLEQQ